MQKYNILLMTVDCLRFDRISANGYQFNTTPNLDKVMSEEGINFTQTIACGPSTMAAFPGLFTSSYPVMYGGTRYLSRDRTTIAEVLSRVGYKTIGLSSNPYITPEFGYDSGFSFFWDSVKRVRSRDRKVDLLSKVIARDSTLWNMLRKMARSGEVHQNKGLYPSSAKMNEKILNAIQPYADNKPFFIWCHYMDLHYPYNLKDIDLRNTLKNFPNSKVLSDTLAQLMNEPESLSNEQRKIVDGIYDASLMNLDEQIGDLFGNMRELGIWENTAVVITADHGEELLEVGRFGHGDEGKDSSFSEALLHIPFVLKMPKSLAYVTEVGSLISQLDIPASILDLVGIKLPSNWYGISALPLIKDSNAFVRKEAITQRGIERSFALSWRTSEWKFVFNAFSGVKKLYKIPDDKYSQDDLIAKYPGVADQLYDEVLEHLNKYQECYSKERLEGIELDDEFKKQLEALGYM